eukprot:sb/3461966/
MSVLVGVRDALRGLEDSIPLIAQQLHSESGGHHHELERQSFALPIICVIVVLREVVNASLATHTQWLATLLTKGSEAWFPCHGDYEYSITTLPITAKGTIVSTVYYSIVAVSCVIGGILGDSTLGRYQTLRRGITCLVTGFVLQTILVVLTYYKVGEMISAGRWVFLTVEYIMLFCSAVLCAIGSGFEAANLLPKERLVHSVVVKIVVTHITGRVFHLFYVLGTLGCLFSNFVLATLQQTAYLVSITIPFLLSLISLGLLVIGRTRFVINRPQLSVYTHVTAILKEGWKLSKVLGVRDTGDRHFLDYRPRVDPPLIVCHLHLRQKRLLDICKVILLFGFYYILYAVADSTFYAQGLFVKTPDSLTYQTSETMDDCTVMIFVPIFLFVIYPKFRAGGTTLLPILLIGYSIGLLSVILGGVFETVRAAEVPITGEEIQLTFYNITFTVTQALHYYERMPQYVLLGLSEVLVAIPALQVIFRASPRQYRSVTNGLLEASKATAVVLVSLSLLVTQVSSYFEGTQWICPNLNIAKLYWYMYLIGQTAYLVSITIPFLLSLISLALLVIGRTRFVINRPQLSVYTHVTAILKEGWKLSKVLGVRDTGDRHFLDYAGAHLGGNYHTVEVEAVKRLLDICKVILLFGFYYILYAVANSTFYAQGLFVKTPDSLTYQTSETMDDCTVMIFVPIFLFVIYPKFRAGGSTLLPILLIGYSIGLLSVILGGVFETVRAAEVPLTGEEIQLTFYNITFTVTQALHYYERMPQYVLLGLSEVLVAIPALQVIFRASPRQYRSVTNGLLEAAKATAVVLVSLSLLVTQVSSYFEGTQWICPNLNIAKLYWYMYLIGVLGVGSLGVAVCFSSKIEKILTVIDAF